MAFDSNRGVILLYGGGTTQFGDICEYNGQQWNIRYYSPSPANRSDHAIAYDSARGVLVVFGGKTNSQFRNDTWEWNGASWAQKTPLTVPQARYDHAMAYDSARGVVVMFGGYGNTGLLQDTWEWDGTNWTLRNSAAGTLRFGNAMCYDSARQRTVMFGGCGLVSAGCSYAWEWDGLSWAQVQVSNPPPGRSFCSMAYDSIRHVSIMFGGTSNSVDVNDLWEWNGVAWTQRDASGSPSPRSRHSAAFDPGRGVMVVYGGLSGNNSLDDLAEWNGTNWAVHSPPTSPGPRYAPAMSFDEARHVAVLFNALSYNYAPETWEWNGLSWSLRNPGTSPSSANGHSMVYDHDRGVTLLFGGGYSNGFYYVALGETWEWNGMLWTRRSISPSPPARGFAALSYDTRRHVAVLFGGNYYNNGTYVNCADTWEWNGTSWTQRNVSGPSGRSYCSMAFDADRGVTVLYGGYPYSNDTWEWDGSSWAQRAPATSPPARDFHSLVYDTARRKTVLAFGWNGSVPLDDTWQWDGSNWSQLAIPTGPVARFALSMTYDKTRQLTVLFGGYNSLSQYLAETWELGPSGTAPAITQDPDSPVICRNSTVSLHAAATGDGTLSYQWQKSGVDLADSASLFGTQTETLVFAHAQPADAGPYACVVKLNNCTQATTNIATLTVYPGGSADGNQDGTVDARDIQPFIDAIVNFAPVSAQLCTYDLTGEGIVDLNDLAPFVSRLLGG